MSVVGGGCGFLDCGWCGGRIGLCKAVIVQYATRIGALMDYEACWGTLKLNTAEHFSLSVCGED